MCKQATCWFCSVDIAGIVCPYSMQVYSSDISAQDEILYFYLRHSYPMITVPIYIFYPQVNLTFYRRIIFSGFSSPLHPTFISPSADNTTPNYYTSSAKLVICSPVTHTPPHFIHTCLLFPTAEDFTAMFVMDEWICITRKFADSLRSLFLCI